jgi:ribose transport system substrate-binding protein
MKPIWYGTRRSLLAGCAGCFSAGCNRGRKRVVGVVPQGRTHLFWQTVQAGARTAAREHGVEVLWNAPQTEVDYNGQLQIVDAMINRRVDALAFSPIDRKAMVAAVDRAMNSRIPVVIFDSGLDGENWVSWVATDNHAGGEMAAERMGKILNGKGKVAITASQPGAASSVAREEGFAAKIRADFPDIEIVDKRYGMADYAKSMAVTENMLTAHPDLDGLFASNETSSVGAMQALKARASRARLVGFDWSPNLLEELRAGRVDSLVVQDPFKIGYESVVAAIRAAEGQPVQKIRKLPARLIRKEDLDRPDVKALLTTDLKKYLE